MLGTKHPSRTSPTPLIFIGCAGWSMGRAALKNASAPGSQLEQYARQFNAVEINSSFYRNHLPRTYARWAESVPDDFRFSVKFPRTITHVATLRDCKPLLADFLAGVEKLGYRLGILLLQLPPRLTWEPAVASLFFNQLREMYGGPVACEPRHISWFKSSASRSLDAHGISRVAADPALVPRARLPAGNHRVEYLRLHGSPRKYYDSYPDSALISIASHLQRSATSTLQRWCMFDNTASGNAGANGLYLRDHLSAINHAAP
jgi:uncharacterized protein YecE (DUF72 family)